MQKSPWKYYHFTCLPRMAIIWCTFREIRSTTGKIFSHFGPFFALLLKNQSFEKKKQPWRYHQLTLVYHKWQSYDAWFLKYKVQQTEFLWTIFCPFDHPPKNLKNKNFKKKKKKKKNSWRYYHMYYKYISENVWFLRYVVWQIEFFFSLWPFFALLLP